MAYVIELTTGNLVLTFEPSLLGTELAAVDPLKATIPRTGRSYNPDSRIWTVSPDYAADLFEVLRDAGIWVARLADKSLTLHVPTKLGTRIAELHEAQRITNVGLWRILTNSITTGEPGRAVAHMIRQNTDLLEVLRDHGQLAVDGQLALDLAHANGDPTPKIRPEPRPPLDESGQLPIAFIVRTQATMQLGYSWNSPYRPVTYRFSLITDPDNFCGSFSESDFIVWAERVEEENHNRLSIPRSIDASNHYTALGLAQVEDKWPDRGQARAAFAAQSLIYHPDHNKASNAAEMFAPVLAAWEFFNRATKDTTGQLFKRYEAGLKIRAMQDGQPARRIVEPAINEKLTARWLTSHINCGMLTGSWLRYEDTGKIQVQGIEAMRPLQNADGKFWMPIQRDNQVIGAWVEPGQYAMFESGFSDMQPLEPLTETDFLKKYGFYSMPK